MPSFTRLLRLSGLCALLLGSQVQAGTVSIAVASNFAAPLQQIAAQFQQDTGHIPKVSSGATGKFYAQIQHGAPFDVLLSADATTPAKLAREGKADAASQLTYAIGQLALWSPQPLDMQPPQALLRSSGWQRLAIANPRVAPYGAAAEQTLQHLGVLPHVTPKLVRGENIGQTYQFVASGNAQLGFVALSQITQNGQRAPGSLWIVPSEMHAPLRQDAILLSHARDRVAAQAFLDYLRSEPARAIMRAYGYQF